ncbi:unnamed protein product [Nyctereutes procyonoides]|uniref:(raccoon dog) hypothetical protein n=1 Tax=Nyctereutes procyonoides TaxID=34880 RepID=A0A811ZQ05_NYCPR|nr:unnamed protein product [Nyctereutes procyonoides]
MSFLLPKLNSKKEVDHAIKSTAEKGLIPRFGRDEDPVCLQLDDILSKTSPDLSKMAAIYLVDVDQTPVLTSVIFHLLFFLQWAAYEMICFLRFIYWGAWVVKLVKHLPCTLEEKHDPSKKKSKDQIYQN